MLKFSQRTQFKHCNLHFSWSNKTKFINTKWRECEHKERTNKCAYRYIQHQNHTDAHTHTHTRLHACMHVQMCYLNQQFSSKKSLQIVDLRLRLSRLSSLSHSFGLSQSADWVTLSLSILRRIVSYRVVLGYRAFVFIKWPAFVQRTEENAQNCLFK